MSRFCTGVLLTLLLISAAQADVHLDIQSGYEGRFRAGRWSPVFVEVWCDPTDKPRTGLLEMSVPSASSSLMQITQAIGISNQKQTYILHAPVALTYNPLRATLRDAESGDVLFDWPPRDRLDVDRGGDQVGFLVVTSGSTPLLRGFNRTDEPGRTIVSHQRQRYLPPAPIGYDSADALVLNVPDWTALKVEQQQAMIAWARSGGVIYLQPGIDPVPENSPFRPHLPADLGELTSVEISAANLKQLGLPQRFERIGVRQLTLRNGARSVPFAKGLPPIAVRPIGLGAIAIIPFDIGALQFNDSSRLNTLWTELFDQSMGKRLAKDPNSYYYTGDIDAAYAALDRIGQIPDTGSFGFGYIAILIGALMMVVGPIDWFVLKKLGRQPWTWATTIGWIGVVTVGAIYAGHLLRSGDLHFRTLRLIEQAGGQVVAIDDVALVYAPRSAHYAIKSDPYTWWQPIPSGNRYGGESFALPLATHQDYRGSQPEPMWINVWNWRFLHGTAYVEKPPVIEASLRIVEGKISGTITNRGEKSLTDIRVQVGANAYTAIDEDKRRMLGNDPAALQTITQNVQMSAGYFELPGEIAPGQTRHITALAPKAPIDTSSDINFRGRYEAPASDETDYHRIFNLSSARNTAAERLLTRGHAIVFATMDQVSTDVAIDSPGAVSQHKAMIRAVVPLGDK